MNEPSQITCHESIINLLFDDGIQKALPKFPKIFMNAAMMLEGEIHIGTASY